MDRLSERFGSIDPPTALGSNVWKVSVAGRHLVAKVGPGITDEADGLGLLAQVGGAVPVPAVVLAEPDLLLTTWVELGRPHAGPRGGVGTRDGSPPRGVMVGVGRRVVVDRGVSGQLVGPA